MAEIVFQQPDCTRRTVLAEPGTTMLRAAKSADIAGILGECGGSLSCGTCHVYIAPDWVGRLPPAQPDEEDMLDFVAAPIRPGSRLCCQIRLTPELDGIVAAIPRQI